MTEAMAVPIRTAISAEVVSIMVDTIKKRWNLDLMCPKYPELTSKSSSRLKSTSRFVRIGNAFGAEINDFGAETRTNRQIGAESRELRQWIASEELSWAVGCSRPAVLRQSCIA